MSDRAAMRLRLLKYILPVFLLSLVFTIPKFFESQIAYKDVNVITAAGENVTRVSEEEEKGVVIAAGDGIFCHLMGASRKVNAMI